MTKLSLLGAVRDAVVGSGSVAMLGNSFGTVSVSYVSELGLSVLLLFVDFNEVGGGVGGDGSNAFSVGAVTWFSVPSDTVVLARTSVTAGAGVSTWVGFMSLDLATHTN